MRKHITSVLNQLKRRWNMSPLLLLMLISLVPFPVLAVVIVADRWIRQHREALS
jgi:hypothetical protein